MTQPKDAELAYIRALLRGSDAADDDGHDPPDVEDVRRDVPDQTLKLVCRNLFRQTDQENP